MLAYCWSPRQRTLQVSRVPRRHGAGTGESRFTSMPCHAMYCAPVARNQPPTPAAHASPPLRLPAIHRRAKCSCVSQLHGGARTACRRASACEPAHTTERASPYENGLDALTGLKGTRGGGSSAAARLGGPGRQGLTPQVRLPKLHHHASRVLIGPALRLAIQNSMCCALLACSPSACGACREHTRDVA